MEMKNLIIVPYAYGGSTGVSIRNLSGQFDTYMKNVCTAAISAVHNAGPLTDVMLVCNIPVPVPYTSLLTDNGVKIERCPFDRFNFGEGVTWQLAFYKLCALAHCVSTMDYDNYCFMDSDVFVQRDFGRIWQDARHNIMLYDVNEPTDGYMVREMQQFLDTDRALTHYGGEFFAASKPLAEKFIAECHTIYDRMMATGFTTRSGDEFITSIAADRLRQQVKNAGAYIRRYWTGSYRLVCQDYDKRNICILHLPAEKETGIIDIYNRYIIHGKVPSMRKVWRMAHLRHRSLRVIVGVTLRKLGVVK